MVSCSLCLRLFVVELCRLYGHVAYAREIIFQKHLGELLEVAEYVVTTFFCIFQLQGKKAVDMLPTLLINLRAQFVPQLLIRYHLLYTSVI